MVLLAVVLRLKGTREYCLGYVDLFGPDTLTRPVALPTAPAALLPTLAQEPADALLARRAPGAGHVRPRPRIRRVPQAVAARLQGIKYKVYSIRRVPQAVAARLQGGLGRV